MAYEPLHHKYRPQTFAQLVGQDAIARTLTNAMVQNKIAPAYLFTGARGTGKTSTARIMAKSLNCLRSDSPTPFPCGECEMCRAIKRGTALDVTEIDAASNTGVDNIREIIERAQFAPVQARFKVYVIDECHMLSNAAFNALLKTLEEPPQRVVFMLATTDPQRVLPTIVSRCQRFDFRRIPLEAMVGHLSHIAQLEQIPIGKSAITLIAQLSQGGLRDGESLLDQLSLLEGEITPLMIWDLVGSVPEQDLLILLAAILEKNGIKLLEQTRQILDRGREPIILLQSMAALYRDLLIAQTAPDRFDLVAWTAEGWEQLKSLGQTIVINNILLGQQHLRTGELQIKNTTQPRLWLEVILMGLLENNVIQIKSTTISPTVAPPKSSTTTKEYLTPKTESIPDSISQPQELISSPVISHSSVITISDRDTEALWNQLLDQLQRSSRSLLSDHAKCLKISSNKVTIGIKGQGIFKIVEGKKKEIGAAWEKVLNRPVEVVLEVISNKEQNPIQTLPSTTPAFKSAEIKEELPPISNEHTLPPTKEQPPHSVYKSDAAIANIISWFGGEVVDLDD